MVIVPMTHDIMERPPKVIGPFTKKQLIGVAAAALVFILGLVFLPVGDFMIRLVIAALLAMPAIVFGYLPHNTVSPMVYVRYFARRVFCGKQIIVHDGTTDYAPKKKTNAGMKITRHPEYKGIR